MKKIISALLPSVVFGVLLVVPSIAAAQFVPLTSLPAVQDVAKSASLVEFLNNIYRLCVGAAAALAVLQIMRGGMEYMLSDSVTEKGHAKHVISMAILGLLLVLSPYIVFSVINPDILDLRIGAERLGDGTDPNGDGTGDGVAGAGNPGDSNDSSDQGAAAGKTEEELRALQPEACAAAGRSYNEELSLCLKKAADTSGDELPECDAGYHVISTEDGYGCAEDAPPEMVTVTWSGTRPGDVIWAGYIPTLTSTGDTQSNYFHTIYRPRSGNANRNEVLIACQNDRRHQSSSDNVVTRVECQFANTRESGSYQVPAPAIRYYTGFSEVDVTVGS